MKFPVFGFTAAVFLSAATFSYQSMAETFRVMLHTGSFPPYFFDDNDPNTGTIRDIYSAIAEETGDNFEYIRVPFKRALHQFESGAIDIEPMTNPAYRSSAAVPGVYSIPFATSDEVILFNKAHYTQVSSPEDLLGQVVGVVNGYYYPKYSPYFEDGRIEAYPVKSENKLIQLIASGRLSQALINKDFAQYQIKKQSLSDQVVLGTPYHSLDMMIRLHPEKLDALPRFNKAINKLLQDGTIEKIYDSYR